MTAKAYIDSLTYQEFEKVRSLKDSPNFYQFLAEPCKDLVTIASFTMQCQSVGIPDTYIRNAEALHYLVAAIDGRINGHA